MRATFTLILLCSAILFGACDLLKEKNESALRNTGVTLEAFFDTTESVALNCYKHDADLHQGTTDPNEGLILLKARYSMAMEDEDTMVVCYFFSGSDDSYATFLNNYIITFYATKTMIAPGQPVAGDIYPIPLLGTPVPIYAIGTPGSECPFDPLSVLVARYDMAGLNNLADYKYVTGVSSSCPLMSLGSVMHPKALLEIYGL